MFDLSVLFVDDEHHIHAGLRRNLRCLRNVWDMEFVESGPAALARMEKRRFDVIVSDMRMPGMDGVRLLTIAMERYPDTVRIILSGQADQMSVLKAATPAHQFLAKPCELESLKRTISKACALRKVLSSEKLLRFVSSTTTLPSLPTVYKALVEELQSEAPCITRVANLITADLSMTAKLLQLVNSSFFGLPRRVINPRHAVTMLGLSVIRPLVLSAGVFSQLEDGQCDSGAIAEIILASQKVSEAAQVFASRFSKDKQLLEDIAASGLLMDIGKLILMVNHAADYQQTVELARATNIQDYEAERLVFGVTHAEIGAYLMGLWGLPDSVVEAIAFHHEPSLCPNQSFSPLTAIHYAESVAKYRHSPTTGELDCCLDLKYLGGCGVTLPLSISTTSPTMGIHSQTVGNADLITMSGAI